MILDAVRKAQTSELHSKAFCSSIQPWLSYSEEQTQKTPLWQNHFVLSKLNAYIILQVAPVHGTAAHTQGMN